MIIKTSNVGYDPQQLAHDLPVFLEASKCEAQNRAPWEIRKNGEDPDGGPTTSVLARDGRLNIGGNALAHRFPFVILRERSDRNPSTIAHSSWPHIDAFVTYNQFLPGVAHLSFLRSMDFHQGLAVY
jgi:hypothetical protein